MIATIKMNKRVSIKDTFTFVFFDLINNNNEMCATEAESMIIITITFQMFSESNISQIARVVIMKPRTEIAIPVFANAAKRCFSCKAELHKAVRLKPPIVKVVKRILASISPNSPMRNMIMPIRALMLNEIIIVIKNTFLKFTSSSIIKLIKQSLFLNISYFKDK